MSHRRVAVTGIGIVSPVGTSTATCWDACLGGRAAVAPIPESWRRWSGLRSGVWAPLPPIDFESAGITPLDAMRLDRSAMLSIVAAGEALSDAGLQPELTDAKRGIYRLSGIDDSRGGVFMGTGVGGITTLIATQNSHLLSPLQPLAGQPVATAPCDATAALDALLETLPQRFNPFSAPMIMPNAISASLGIRYSLHGPNASYAVACAAGTAAIGHAFRSIRGGETNIVLCGGAEFVGDPFGGVFRVFDTARTLTTGGGSPATANRPFDTARTGFLMAEGGAAVLVCEEWEHARRRGGRIHAEIAGYGETFDAYSMMIVEPSGEQLERAIAASLADAGITAGHIDYVNAHGTGTLVNDDVESAVLERMFGPRPLVSATKSLTGHCIGASGAIEAAVTALSLRDQRVHGCVNLDDPVRPLNFARCSADATLDWAVSQSSAFGGHNAAVVLRRAATE
jgi:3-oxoacyl-[acyl-carrier-protein] synthase II